jgi:hypothetical protein
MAPDLPGAMAVIERMLQQEDLPSLAKRISHAADGDTVVLSTGVQNVAEVKQVLTAIDRC